MVKTSLKPSAMGITITPPQMRVIKFNIAGTAPLMMLKFSEKSRRQMMNKHALGSTAKKGNKREARDFDQDFREAIHRSTEGWTGVPASAFRNACIDVCRMAGYQMTRAKMSIFIDSDGLDETDGTPLIKLIAENPERTEMPVRNATGVADIRIRPMWREWSLELRVIFDADQFTVSDVANLVLRAGMQVGICEGRPYSKNSNGMGYGTFTIKNQEQVNGN